MVMLERVDEAQRMAAQEMRDQERKKGGNKRKGGRGRGDGDDHDSRMRGLMKRKKLSSMKKGNSGGRRR